MTDTSGFFAAPQNDEPSYREATVLRHFGSRVTGDGPWGLFCLSSPSGGGVLRVRLFGTEVEALRAGMGECGAKGCRKHEITAADER